MERTDRFCACQPRELRSERRREFGTPYPLATARPFVVDKELVLEIQERNDLPSTIAIVVRSGQEIMLADGANRFFRKIEFDPRGRDAAEVRPLGKVSPVVIDPLVRFGRAAVSGVATERLWELFDAGESIGEIAAGYELSERTPRSTKARRPARTTPWSSRTHLMTSLAVAS